MLRSSVDSTAAVTDKITGLEVTCGMLSGRAWNNIQIFVAECQHIVWQCLDQKAVFLVETFELIEDVFINKAVHKVPYLPLLSGHIVPFLPRAQLTTRR